MMVAVVSSDNVAVAEWKPFDDPLLSSPFFLSLFLLSLLLDNLERRILS